MLKERLDLFFSKQRKLPSRILVYRDGVSEVYAFNTIGESPITDCD